MARNQRIRIMERDKQEYQRLRRNTQAKIRRTQKNYGIDLSGDVTLPNSIDDFSTRQEFNQWKNQMRSFTNRANQRYQFEKNPYGVVASKKEINDIKELQEQAQENARRMREKLGESRGAEREEERQFLKRPDLQGFSMPKDFDFQNVKHQWRLQQMKENYKDRADPNYYDEKLSTMQDNFIRSVEGTLGAIGENGEDVIDMLKSLSPEAFYDLYLRDEGSSFMNFEVWDSEGQMIPSEQEVRQHLSNMGSFMQRYFDGKINTDLKNF